MKNLIIKETNYTPKIDFNVDNNIFSIHGKSYPENTFEFYSIVVEWLNDFFNSTIKANILVDIELVYLNSSSLKLYFEIFDIFEESSNKNHQVNINWIYEKDDDIMEETGIEFINSFPSLNINLVKKN